MVVLLNARRQAGRFIRSDPTARMDNLVDFRVPRGAGMTEAWVSRVLEDGRWSQLVLLAATATCPATGAQPHHTRVVSVVFGDFYRCNVLVF